MKKYRKILMATVLSSLFVSAILTSVLILAAFKAEALNSSIKIMPLGDSITRGGPPYDDPPGYRQKLYVDLTNAGFSVDFVGNLSDGGLAIPPFFDTDHDGHGGKTASWLNPRLNGPTYDLLPRNPPDIILYHIGTNDLGDSDIVQYAADANESVRIIYEFDSDITVILAKIILTTDSARNIRTHDYNVLLEGHAQFWSDLGYSIIVVDMENALDYPGDLADTVHPTAAGYGKMADVWFEAVVKAINCPRGMISYWKLDETVSGDYEDSFDGNNGTCGAGTSCPDPTTDAVVTGAQQFASGTGIDVPADPSFNWNNETSFSIEFWMKRDGALHQVIVGRDDQASPGGTKLHWWVGSWGSGDGGVAAFVIRDTTGSSVGVLYGTTNLGDNSSHHVVAVRDTSEIRIYVDGSVTPEDTQTVSYTSGFGSMRAALNIGYLAYMASPDYHYTGILDEVAIYNRALSPEEIQLHHELGLAGKGYCEAEPVAPEITSTPVTEACVGGLYTYDVDATGFPSPTYELTTSPTGMTINPTTGLISWEPSADQAGYNDVTVNATNSEGTDTQDFSINVFVCPDDIISYWKLDETDPGTYHDLYGGNHGSCGGTCPTPTTGLVNGAQQFIRTVVDPSAGTEINVPGDSFNWGATDSFSIEFWMKKDSPCSGNKVLHNEVIVGRDDHVSGTDLHWWVGVNAYTGGGHPQGIMLFGLMDKSGTGDSAWIYTDSVVVTDGTWHHIVARKNETHTSIFVNGTQQDSTPASFSHGFDAATPLNIGYMAYAGNPGFHYTGILDEVAIYNRALSPEEILEHYNNGLLGMGYCQAVGEVTGVVAPSGTVDVYQTFTLELTFGATLSGPTPREAVISSNIPSGWTYLGYEATLNGAPVTFSETVDSSSVGWQNEALGEGDMVMVAQFQAPVTTGLYEFNGAYAYTAGGDLEIGTWSLTANVIYKLDIDSLAVPDVYYSEVLPIEFDVVNLNPGDITDITVNVTIVAGAFKVSLIEVKDFPSGTTSEMFEFDTLDLPSAYKDGGSIDVIVRLTTSDDELLDEESTTSAILQATREALWARVTDIVLEWPTASPEEREELWEDIVAIVLLWPMVAE